MNRLIIIIGLCGSGKTCLSKRYDDYIVFDDFVSQFYNDDVINALQQNKKVCLTDPRLCIYETFIKFMKKLEIYVSKNNITLILFENNPLACLENIKLRNDGRKGIVATINKYTLIYDLDNYKNYNYIIMPIWTILTDK